MYSHEVLQKRGKTLTDSSKCKLGGKFGIGVLGYLLVDIGVKTTLGALCRQVLLRLASSAPEKLSAKCPSCSFNSSRPEFMLEHTSPCKIGSVCLNMNSSVLEPESVKFFPFSGELYLMLYLSQYSEKVYCFNNGLIQEVHIG